MGVSPRQYVCDVRVAANATNCAVTRSCGCEELGAIWNETECRALEAEGAGTPRKSEAWHLMAAAVAYCAVGTWVLSAYVWRRHWGERSYYAYIDCANLASRLFHSRKKDVSGQKRGTLRHLTSGTAKDDRIDVGLGCSMRRIVVQSSTRRRSSAWSARLDRMSQASSVSSEDEFESAPGLAMPRPAMPRPSKEASFRRWSKGATMRKILPGAAYHQKSDDASSAEEEEEEQVDSDVTFASQHFFAREGGGATENYVLLVRRKHLDTDCTVAVSSYEIHMGARAGIHFEPLVRRKVRFAPGVAAARVRIDIIHQDNWDATLLFGLRLEHPVFLKRTTTKNKSKKACRECSLEIVHVNWRSCKVLIINTDPFPRSRDAEARDKWPSRRMWSFCRYLHDDLRASIPLYFRPYFVLWYLAQFTFHGCFTSAFVPWLYRRLVNVTIPENRVSEAVLLSAVGMFGMMLLQRVHYSFYGHIALGRFNSLRLIRYFGSIPYLDLQDTSLNGRFHKLFTKMEQTITNTWKAALDTWKLFIRLVIVVVASFFLDADTFWLFPSALLSICLVVVCVKAAQVARGWPSSDCFFQVEERETALTEAVDNIISNRVLHRSLRTDERAVRLADEGYQSYLAKRDATWYYIDMNYWSKNWARAGFFWLLIAVAPILVAREMISVVEFSIMLYLMVLVGNDLSDLDDNWEKFRYGLAQLDYLDETLNNDQYTAFRIKLADASLRQLAYWERSLNSTSHRITSSCWEDLLFHRVDGTDIPESWLDKASTGDNLMNVRCDDSDDLVDCNSRLPARGALCGVQSQNDRFLHIKILWLLSGEVLPIRGDIFRPPRTRVILVPADLDCTPIAVSLMDNLRFGCGSVEVSGIADDVIWNLCARLGMKKELIGADKVLTRSSLRYYERDIALMHLAQHLLLYPDVLLVNNTRCINPVTLRALSAYAQGGLLPCTALIRRYSNEEDSPAAAPPPEPPDAPRRTVIVRLPDDGADYQQYVDLNIDISTTSPTTIKTVVPKRAIGARGQIHRHSV